MVRTGRGRRAAPLGEAGEPADRLGATIRAWREDRGLSATALAERAGFGRTGRGYVSKVEHGRIAPGDDKLNRIAAALGVSSTDLLLRRMPAGAAEPPTDVEAPGGPKTRAERLRDVLRRTAEIERIVGELLREEEVAPPSRNAAKDDRS